MEKKAVSAIMLTLLLTSMLMLAFNIQPAKAASEIIIDTHGDSRFTRYPSGPYWWSVADHDVFYTRAYNNNFWYTYCGDAAHGGDLYFGMWTPSVIGEYEVFVWIPNPDPFGTYTPTHSANYQIWHSSGLTERVVNQALRLGGWYSLGSFTFDASSSIILNDRTGEPYISTMIAFDAIKFVTTSPINQPFTLNNGYVSPSSGDTSTTFSYYVTYSDPEGDLPTLKYVYIDYSPNTMVKISGDYVSGAVFRYSTTLSVGSHNYYFSFEDSVHGHTKSLPPSGTYPGPNVPPPDFSITSSPTSLTIQKGSSGTSTITITSMNGFNQPVQLTKSGVPSGVTATLNPTQVTPPVGGSTTSTLTVSVGTTATPGSYTLTVTGTSSTITHSVYISLEVTSGPPPPNQLPNPPSFIFQFRTDSTQIPVGETTVESSVVFYGVVSDPDGDRVRLQIELRNLGEYNGEFNEDAGQFKESELVPSGSEAYAFAQELIDHFYHWRARAVDEHGDKSEWVDFGDNSIYWTDFAVDMTPPETFILDGPEEGATLPGNDVGFTCTGWDMITSYLYLKYSYRLEGYDAPGAWSDWEYPDSGVGSWSCTDLSDGDYTFQVRAKDEVGHIDPSPAERSFTVAVRSVKWEKTVKVIPEGLLPGSEIGAKVSYNWVRTDEQGKDVFQINKIEGWSNFFVGAYRISIESESGTLWSNLNLATPLWMTYYPEQLYAYADDWISVKAYGITEKEALGLWGIAAKMVGLPSLPPGDVPFFVGHNEDYLAPPYIDRSGFPPIAEEGEIYSMIIGCICSPGELRIYDAQGRVTGLVNGEVREEIPNSAYFNGILVILSQNDSYRHEVVGTEEKEYKLGVISVEAEEANAFIATDVPTASEAMHHYTIDWAALSLGEEGVTVEVDSDGNGVSEYTFTSDSELTQNEFLIQTGQSALYTFSILWGAETFIVSVESNSTVSDFAFSQPDKRISFDASGSADTIGFCNVTIPKALLYGPWIVLIDGASVSPIITENSTHSCLYFTYAHSTHTIQIMGSTVIGPPPPPLSVSISPLSASILVGQSVTFTSTVLGGVTPYGYQWYLDGAPVLGATSNTWTFAPTTTGSYIVYLNVTDNMGNTAKSNEASVAVAAQLAASISPMSASVLVGQPVAFTSTVSGGYTPYSYQWYLNGNPVSGANATSWTFTPTAGGIYYIHLKVTDAKANTAQSETARITAATVPVGGYSIPIQVQTKTEPIIPYIALIATATLTAIFTKLRPKTKRKH